MRKQNAMFRTAMIVLSLILTAGVLFYNPAHTHSGRTDANGGHYNRKTGEYHYHNRDISLPELQPSLIPYPTEDFFLDTAYPVTRIIDGDTVEIRHDGRLRSVRLIGVDTPETVHPTQNDQPYGKEATAFISNLLIGESVYLRFDGNKTDQMKTIDARSQNLEKPSMLAVN